MHGSDVVTVVNGSQPNNQTRRQLDDENDYDDNDDTPRPSSTGTALLNAIQELPWKLRKSNTRLLQTHVSNIRGSKDEYNEFEHLLQNHFQPIANKYTEKDRIHFLQSLFRDEAIDFWQTITSTSTTTLQDVLQFFRKDFAKEICVTSHDTVGMKPSTTQTPKLSEIT